MKQWTLVVMMAGMVGCGVAEAPAVDELHEPPTRDYCEEFGWYNDGRCDECLRPDPDCSEVAPQPEPEPQPQPEPEPQPEPQPEPDPYPACIAEHSQQPEDYVAFGETCEVIDFACIDGYVGFDNTCGCGCEPLVTTLPVVCLDDTLPTVDRIGDAETCARINYICADGWVPFEDDCGCGCQAD